MRHVAKERDAMQQPKFVANQTWFPALMFTLVFVAFYFLFFSGVFLNQH
jgi:hypothetical protein